MEEAKGSVSHFCPECGSASLDYGTLVGSLAKCTVCNWKGPREGLLAHTFRHEHGSDTDVLKAILNDMRLNYAGAAKLFGDTLIKWGFVAVDSAGNINKRHVARYISSMAMASFKAIIEVRQQLEKERIDG